jgi:YHS domain-containing protein
MLRLRSGNTAIKYLVAIVLIAIPIGVLAYTQFGAKHDTTPPAAGEPPTPSKSSSDEDRQLIAKQKICPVSGQSLDSMGEPYRTEVEGKVVFVCCKSCTSALKKDPEKYLAKLK